MFNKPWGNKGVRLNIKLVRVSWVDIYIIEFYVDMSSPFLFVTRGGDAGDA